MSALEVSAAQTLVKFATCVFQFHLPFELPVRLARDESQRGEFGAILLSHYSFATIVTKCESRTINPGAIAQSVVQLSYPVLSSSSDVRTILTLFSGVYVGRKRAQRRWKLRWGPSGIDAGRNLKVNNSLCTFHSLFIELISLLHRF